MQRLGGAAHLDGPHDLKLCRRAEVHPLSKDQDEAMTKTIVILHLFPEEEPEISGDVPAGHVHPHDAVGHREALVDGHGVRHPVTGVVTHVDFKRVDLTLKLEVRVPIHLMGTPAGVKNDGGILDFIHREVEVRCLPTAIPEHVEVDVEGLEVGQHLEIKDLPALEGVEYHEDAATVIAVVAAARAEEEPETEDEEGATPSDEEADKSGDSEAKSE